MENIKQKIIEEIGTSTHNKNEYVEIKSAIEVTKIYALTAFDFSG